MFARLILYLFLSIIAANTLVRAGSNRISSSAIQVNEPLTDAEIQQIQSNEWWPSQTVELGAEAETFASLKQIPRIRFLELANANQNITSFESIRSLPNLVSFRASRPRLNQDKPWSVAALAHCKNLIYLNLDRILITDEDSLSSFTKLRYLILVGSGISSLNCLNSMPALQDLYLDDSDALIASYAPLGSLEQLSLSKDRYPESELEVLRASIPMLRIAAY